MMQPNGCWRSADVQNYLDSGLGHLLQDLIKPCEFKLSVGWFKGVPGKVAAPTMVNLACFMRAISFVICSGERSTGW